MDLGLDTGLRNLPIVVKRMQRRQWGRIVPAFWDGEELSGWGITKIILWAGVLFLPFAPTITLFSRVLWIYLDQTVDPDQPR